MRAVIPAVRSEGPLPLWAATGERTRQEADEFLLWWHEQQAEEITPTEPPTEPLMRSEWTSAEAAGQDKPVKLQEVRRRRVGIVMIARPKKGVEERLTYELKKKWPQGEKLVVVDVEWPVRREEIRQMVREVTELARCGLLRAAVEILPHETTADAPARQGSPWTA